MYRVGRQAGAFGSSGASHDDRPIEKRIWDFLQDIWFDRAQSLAELAQLLKRLPDRKLDLSQQEPLSARAMDQLFDVLIPGPSDLKSGVILDQLILGRVEGSLESVNWWDLRVSTLDLSRLRKYSHGGYKPLTPGRVRRLQDQAESRTHPDTLLQTVVVDRSSTLQGQIVRWQSLQTHLRIEFVDRGLPARERDEMVERALHLLLVNTCSQGHVDDVLNDPGSRPGAS